MQPIDVKALTWNLNWDRRGNALDTALRYLAAVPQNTPAVGALQEAPQTLSSKIVTSGLSLQKPAAGTGTGTGTGVPPGIAIVHNQALTPVGNVLADSDGEFIAQKFSEATINREFWVVSVHATSLRDREMRRDSGLGGARALLRDRINQFHNGEPIVIMGDFNCEPLSEAMYFWNAFYATNTKFPAYTQPVRQSRCTRLHPPLKVAIPSWKKRAKVGPQGTFIFNDNGHESAHTFDFVVTDEATKVNAQILTSWRRTKLWSPNATLGKINLSDHLPVIADITI